MHPTIKLGLPGFVLVFLFLSCAAPEEPPPQQPSGRPVSPPHGPGLYYLPPLSYPTPACDQPISPHRLLAEDLDGDSHLDLISVDFLCYFLLVAYGHGDGTFEPVRALSLGRPYRPPVLGSPLLFPTQLGSGDFDQDGIMDLAFDGLVGAYLLFGQTRRQFRSAQSVTMAGPENMLAIASADFDKDGKLDLISGDSKNGILMARNQGLDNGWIRFTQAQHFPSGVSAELLSIADLNRDGLPDIVSRSKVDMSQPQTLAIWYNQGQGKLKTPSLLNIAEHLGGVTACDLDGDGVADIVVSYAERAGVAWLRGRPDGTYESPRQIPTDDKGETLEAVYCADLDGDRNNDLICPAFGGISIIRGLGRGSFAPPRLLSFDGSLSGASDVVVADFDRDGRPDIAATAIGRTQDLIVLLNDTQR